jgi:hypothetical protein
MWNSVITLTRVGLKENGKNGDRKQTTLENVSLRTSHQYKVMEEEGGIHQTMDSEINVTVWFILHGNLPRETENLTQDKEETC